MTFAFTVITYDHQRQEAQGREDRGLDRDGIRFLGRGPVVCPAAIVVDGVGVVADDDLVDVTHDEGVEQEADRGEDEDDQDVGNPS